MLKDVIAFYEALQAVKPTDLFYNEAKEIEKKLMNFLEAFKEHKELRDIYDVFNELLNSVVRNQATLNTILTDSYAIDYLRGLQDLCHQDPIIQYKRTMTYLTGIALFSPRVLATYKILKNSTTENVSTNNNNNNTESAVSFAPVVKSKPAREVKAEMLQTLKEKLLTSEIQTPKEAMDFVKQYIKESVDIKPAMKALTLQGMDKEVEKLMKEVKSVAVSNSNISPQL